MGGGIRLIPGVQAEGFEFHGRAGLSRTIGGPHSSKIKPAPVKFPTCRECASIQPEFRSRKRIAAALDH
jgi:hypothetical protein